LKNQILIALPAVSICIAIIAGDLIVTPRFSEVPEEFTAVLDRSALENVSSVNNTSSVQEQADLNDEAILEEQDNPFGPKVEYFSFIEPIAGTFFDVGTNYVFNVSIATNLSPVIENPFDTEFERLTTILKPIVVDETVGLKRSDLFSDMFRDKLGRLLASAFNAELLDAGYDPIVSNVELIDFWAP
jgi:hypothetical protein